MTRIFDEKFEGAGYEESWTEAVGAGCTIDQDAATSDVSSPAGWDSQCLKIITASGVANYTYSQIGDGAIRYTRIEAIFTSLSDLTLDAHYFILGGGVNNALATGCFYVSVYRSGGVNYLVFDPYYDGASHLDAGSALACSLTPDTGSKSSGTKPITYMNIKLMGQAIQMAV